MVANPNKRLTIDEISEHPWMQQLVLTSFMLEDTMCTMIQEGRLNRSPPRNVTEMINVTVHCVIDGDQEFVELREFVPVVITPDHTNSIDALTITYDALSKSPLTDSSMKQIELNGDDDDNLSEITIEDYHNDRRNGILPADHGAFDSKSIESSLYPSHDF